MIGIKMIEVLVILAAYQIDLDKNLLLSTCQVETNLRNVIVKNDGGSPSYGICQVKLGTAKSIDPVANPNKLMDPYYNALIAGKYIKRMIKRFDGYTWKAIGAYNAGPTKMSRWLDLYGKPMNITYIEKVKHVYRNYNKQRYAFSFSQ